MRAQNYVRSNETSEMWHGEHGGMSARNDECIEQLSETEREPHRPVMLLALTIVATALHGGAYRKSQRSSSARPSAFNTTIWRCVGFKNLK